MGIAVVLSLVLAENVHLHVSTYVSFQKVRYSNHGHLLEKKWTLCLHESGVILVLILIVYAYGYLIWVGYLFFILLFGWKQANILNYWQYTTMSNQINTTNKKVIVNFYFLDLFFSFCGFAGMLVKPLYPHFSHFRPLKLPKSKCWIVNTLTMWIDMWWSSSSRGLRSEWKRIIIFLNRF